MLFFFYESTHPYNPHVPAYLDVIATLLLGFYELLQQSYFIESLFDEKMTIVLNVFFFK